MRPGSIGPWLTDIAANFLAITLIVLVVVAQSQVTAPEARAQTLPVQNLAPEGGAAAIELLRQRLQTPLLIAAIDLTAEGVRTTGQVSAPTVLFVLEQTHHAAMATALSNEGRRWRELTTPQALTNGKGDWAPAFLALADRADKPDAFREGLLDLLSRGASAQAVALSSPPDPTLRSRLRAFLQISVDALVVIGLIALSLGLWRLRLWAAKE